MNELLVDSAGNINVTGFREKDEPSCWLRLFPLREMIMLAHGHRDNLAGTELTILRILPTICL